MKNQNLRHLQRLRLIRRVGLINYLWQISRLFKLSLEKNLKINNEIIAAKYPDIFRNGGSINGRAIKIFKEGFTFS